MTAELITIAKGKDADGFPTDISGKTEVYAEEKSITRSEYYESMRSGIQVKAVLEVRIEDYESAVVTDGSKKTYPARISYDGNTYDIVRTYRKGKSKIELIVK